MHGAIVAELDGPGWATECLRDSGEALRPRSHRIARVGCEPKPGRAAHLFACWNTIRQRMVLAKRVTLLSDFDGTLVPLQRRPGDVRLPSSLRRLFRRLMRGGIKVGVISGRAIQDVRKKVGIDGIWYAGSHGNFLTDPRGRPLCLLPPEMSSQMKCISRLLQRRFRCASGLEVEPKDGTVAVHYRRATNTERAWAYQVLREVLASEKHLRLMQGKKVWEFLPQGAVDKWKAVQVILNREHFVLGKDLLVYLGDDVTDEVVFRKMCGLSVSVGEALRTAADFYLASHVEVKEFLQRIDDIMKGREKYISP
jgi:trehalose-phosphatase